MLIIYFIALLSSMYFGLKLLCDDHDRRRRERDELWDRNGWARPNKKTKKVSPQTTTEEKKNLLDLERQ